MWHSKVILQKLAFMDAAEASDVPDTYYEGVLAFKGHQHVFRYCVGYFRESLISEAKKASSRLFI